MKKNILVLFQVFQSLPSELSPAKIRRSGNVEDHDHDTGDDDEEEEEDVSMKHVADERSNGHGTKNKMFC